jgi:hypothetical protein
MTVALPFAMATEAMAWGASGHRLISELGAASLPQEIPSFLRTARAVEIIRELGTELDRSKDSGTTHDKERDSGHFLDLDDNAAVLGIIPLTQVPLTREAYDSDLRAAKKTQYQAGYLLHALLDGWQQLRKDFALWRVATIGAATATDLARRARFEKDRDLREMLILRDLGVWSHYVGDASQPLHLSIHFNGWGDYPNPKGYSKSETLHAEFEGEFVRRFVTGDLVAAVIAPYRDCACAIEERIKNYLRASHAMVVPLYELEATGAFKRGDAAGVSFVVQRLAAGAAELRDLVVEAWRASAEATVGYPRVNVRDIEAGRIDPTVPLFGAD